MRQIKYPRRAVRAPFVTYNRLADTKSQAISIVSRTRRVNVRAALAAAAASFVAGCAHGVTSIAQDDVEYLPCVDGMRASPATSDERPDNGSTNESIYLEGE